jgi:hypothetical protein
VAKDEVFKFFNQIYSEMSFEFKGIPPRKKKQKSSIELENTMSIAAAREVSFDLSSSDELSTSKERISPLSAASTPARTNPQWNDKDVNTTSTGKSTEINNLSKKAVGNDENLPSSTRLTKLSTDVNQKLISLDSTIGIMENLYIDSKKRHNLPVKLDMVYPFDISNQTLPINTINTENQTMPKNTANTELEQNPTNNFPTKSGLSPSSHVSSQASSLSSKSMISAGRIISPDRSNLAMEKNVSPTAPAPRALRSPQNVNAL